MHQEVLDYEKHCKIPFGTYVQAHTEPKQKNSVDPRTLDCIYLRPLANHQGGHELMDLSTGRTINRNRVTPVAITKQVIEQVEKMAEKEQMPKGLKVETKRGAVLYDAAWIAGVSREEDSEVGEDDEEELVEQENAKIEADEDEDQEDYVDVNEIAEILGETDVANEEDDGYYDEPAEEEYFEEDNDIVNDGESVEEEDDNAESEDEEVKEVEEDNPTIAEAEENVEEDNVVNDEEDVQKTRSGRTVKKPSKYSLHQCHIITQAHEATEYTREEAILIAMIMCMINKKWQAKEAQQFAQTYSLKKGLKVLGKKGEDAVYDEMKQLHDRTTFEPTRVEDLTPTEKQRAMESLIFLAEKRDGTAKARTCANGSTQRAYTPKEEAASPTVMLESIFITGVIEAKQGRDNMTSDIPNAFVQTEVPRKNGERVIMKIRGFLVDVLVEIAPEVYASYVVWENGEKVLYVIMLKALYGMLTSALLYYKKFVKDIQEIGFELNPYDPCVANRMVNGKQHTITWHVDDLKSSHVDPKVNDDFLKWLQEKYGSVKKVEGTRGKKHDYLAMTLDYSEPGVLKVDMVDYVKGMVEDFPEELDEKVKGPWTEKLFKIDEKAPPLSKKKAEVFHTFVMKGMFLCKRARQDIQPAIAFLATRVKEPNEADWQKLIRVLRYLKATQNDVLRLEADDTQTIKWHVDAAFAVHKDMKSHTGATMTLGKGTIASVSTKQKVNTRSSTEAELVSIDDIISKVIWTKRFIEAQGFKVNANIIYRDNQSSMKLEENGKESSGKRTRHFDIKYFYITDLIKQGEVEIEYCPTDDMMADYMTKPLVGVKYHKFRGWIMNINGEKIILGQQECVGGEVKELNTDSSQDGIVSKVMRGATT